MQIEMCCQKCGKIYLCVAENTKVTGPVIDTTCPFCREISNKNFSAFLYDQTDRVPGRLIRASSMIRIGQLTGKLLNDDYIFMRRKKVK